MIRHACLRNPAANLPAGQLGLSNPTASRRFDLSTPLEGPIPEDRLFGSGSIIALPAWKAVTIELELAVVLSRPITPDERLRSCDGLIRSCHLALEIVSSCFQDRLGVGLPSFVADRTGCFAVVLGEEKAGRDPPAAGSQGCLKVGDQFVTVAEDSPGRLDPRKALVQFLNEANRGGVSVPAGSLIMTGALGVVEATDGVVVEGSCVTRQVTCRLTNMKYPNSETILTAPVLSTVPFIPADNLALSLGGERAFKAHTPSQRKLSPIGRRCLTSGLQSDHSDPATYRFPLVDISGRDPVPEVVLERIDTHVKSLKLILPD